jgi:AraC-like DNA-binding protein
MNTLILAGNFQRPDSTLKWAMPRTGTHSFQLNGGAGWQSYGGPHKGHPARAYPYTLEIPVPQNEGKLVRVHLAGVFALWSEPQYEALGTRGASVSLTKNGDMIYRLDLVSGRHYSSPTEFPSGCRLNGDGSSLEMIDIIEINGTRNRVDLLTIDISEPIEPDRFVFRDLGTMASFVLFDVLFEFGGKKTCPFKHKTTGISLSELVSIIRIGDRVQFSHAIDQLEQEMKKTDGDLDEARGLALTFLAVTSAALLELDAPRGLHRFQLEAARKLDVLNSIEDIIHETKKLIQQITGHMIPSGSSTGHPLVDHALTYVDRNFAREMDDRHVSDHIGLSTSHFRFLFKQTVGVPFHKYLIALRLERARQMLLQTEIPVQEVAESVGFKTLVHFSRAFTKKFSVSPTTMRKSKKHHKTVNITSIKEAV